MPLRHLRTILVALIATVCIGWAIRQFDWRAVANSVARMRLGMFLAGEIPLFLAVSGVRGLRWLVVLGIKLDRGRFWQSFCANGAASGLASLTPFQFGELIKIRTIPEQARDTWQRGLSGFFAERILDLSGAIGVGLAGLSIHFDLAWLAPLAWALPLAASTLLYLLAPCASRLPRRLHPYVEAFRRRRHIVGASVLTMIVWSLYDAQWWVAARSIGVHLEFEQSSILLGSVMLAVVSSMVPGGLGVAELGSRDVMLWLGASPVAATATAIALRLLTPLFALLGAACWLWLSWLRRSMIVAETIHAPSGHSD